MGNIIHWFSRNHVAANFIMGAVLLAGFTTWIKLKKEIFPETETNFVAVKIAYPGATPEEVEKGVCVPGEEAIQDLEGIDTMKSTSVDSYGVVYVEVANNFDLRDVMDDIKSRVDAIENLAENAEAPVYEEILIKNQVLTVAIYADTDERTLRGYAEEVRDGLLSYQPPPPQGFIARFAALFRKDNGISQVELSGVRPFEIAVNVSEDTLRAYGLSFGQVAEAIRSSSLDLPGGSVRTDAGEILIKAQAKRYTAGGFENIPVITRPDGTQVVVGELATVIDGFEDIDMSSRFDGKAAAAIQVFRIGDEDTLDVARAAKGYIEHARRQLPKGVSLEVWNDSSRMLEGRLDLLARNGFWGLILVLIVLSLFLRPSLAALVTIGIPVSFAGAIWMMPYTGISVNMITLFAFILVLGIVVDDAIVVGENVYRRIRAGEDPRAASWRGTHEVGVVVIFGVLTTAIAFAPMLGISGVSGKIWRNIPWIVIPTLLFSLLQSKLILPAHLALLRPANSGTKQGFILRFQDRIARGLEHFVETFYRPVLRRALHARYVVLAIFFALFVVTLGVIGGGRIKMEFFPEVEAEIIATKISMVDGVAFETTSAAVARIEAAAVKLNELYSEHNGRPLVLHMLASVGSQPFKTGFTPITPRGSNLGEVALELLPGAEREVTAKELAAQWRKLSGDIPGVAEISFQSQAAGGGNAIDLELSGGDFEQLRSATEYVKDALSGIDGIIDINDSDRNGKREVILESLLPAGEALGLRLSDVARQMRRGFYGEEVQRLQRGRDQIKVMVRYPKAERESLENIEQMRIRTRAGNEIPLSAVVEFGEGRGAATIQRTDRMRTIRIAADIDKNNENANANEARRTLEEDTLMTLGDRFPGIQYKFQGEQKDQRQSMKEMGIGFLFALLAMFVLMAIPLRSYIQPLIVMSVIPFGIVGAVTGHILMGTNLSIMSMCGIIALAGVVVNDSLVLVDYVNRRRIRGQSVMDAAWAAGAARFRPILLTSLTTFAGLTPMLLETDLQAKFLIPMAISLGFGILFATTITLLLVPCVYLMLEDFKCLVFKPGTLQRWEQRRIDDAAERNDNDSSEFAM
ncbi:MAG: efflux RND transporter permease subunit [Verrucomicrobiales bacterium]